MDYEIRQLIKSSQVDFEKIPFDYPYPLVWDKDLNFIGHLQPERSKREDYPDGSIWRDSSSFKKEDESYNFYGITTNEWKFLGRFKHFIDVTWERCGALNS